MVGWGMMRWCFLLVGMLGVAWGGELEDAKAEWEKADGRLNLAYGALKETLGADGFELMKLEQRGWIGYRDYMAEWLAQTEGQAEEGKEEQVARYWEVMGEVSAERAAVLEGMAKERVGDGWEGEWSDGRGGYLSVAKVGGKWRFLLSVVRGPTYHLGNLGGEFEVNRGTGRFSVKEETAAEATWLTFLQRDDGRIEVVGENTSYYHGARAYFDGKYARVGDLTGEELEAVKRGGWEVDR